MERLTMTGMTLPRATRGFTLLEVMLALTVMAIGVLSLTALQLMTMDHGGRGKHATHAGIIAQNTMDRLQRVRWTDASVQPTAGWSGPTTVGATVQDGVTLVESSYDVYVRITNSVVGVSRTIDVRVDWNEPKQPSRSFALSSLRYNLEGL